MLLSWLLLHNLVDALAARMVGWSVVGAGMPTFSQTETPMDTSNEMSLISAYIDFFGLKEGQSRPDFFRDEYKYLTSADRVEIAAGLRANGYRIKE